MAWRCRPIGTRQHRWHVPSPCCNSPRLAAASATAYRAIQSSGRIARQPHTAGNSPDAPMGWTGHRSYRQW